MSARLHVVTDDRVLARADFLPVAQELFSAGGRQLAIHLRGHATRATELLRLAQALNLPANQLIINDRIDVALAADVPAVQLGARSLPLSSARKLLPSGARIGYSAHSAQEAATAAAEGADFLLVGSIYASASHPERKAAGVALLKECERSDIPVYAIGGITVERVAELKAAGAYGIAVIGGIWQRKDPVHAAEQFIRVLQDE